MGIKIKGKADGVFEIEIQPFSAYAEIKKDIKEKLSKNNDFFTGTEAKIIFSGKILSEAQRRDIKRMLSMDYNIFSVEFLDEIKEKKIDVSVKHIENNDAENISGKKISSVSNGCFNAKSVFVSQTLRSGQRIECEGDIVVLGDVNDGAEVIAGGNIAVMGALRGLAHAGATGRSDVVVAANSLMPKQLRISGKIAMFPKDEQINVAQMAQYKHGSIVIKPLKPLSKQIKR